MCLHISGLGRWPLLGRDRNFGADGRFLGDFWGLRDEVGLDLDGFSTPPITSIFRIASVLKRICCTVFATIKTAVLKFCYCSHPPISGITFAKKLKKVCIFYSIWVAYFLQHKNSGFKNLQQQNFLTGVARACGCKKLQQDKFVDIFCRQIFDYKIGRLTNAIPML